MRHPEQLGKYAITGLLGEGAQSAEAVGMAFAKGITTGDKGNVKLRFDPSYMDMAAQGKL